MKSAYRSRLVRFFPFLAWWPLVTRDTLRDDLLAGITGALIVLPQGVAFATIAGMPPEYGLYAAMMPAVIGALWGSSWHLVSGPTTAISIAVFAALSHQAEPGSAQYISLVLTVTFLVGLFQLMLGLARMGALVNFISHTVVIGFTAGAAVLIAASQVRNFFGIDIPRGTPFYEIVHQLFVQFGDIKPWVLTVSLATLLTGILTKRFFPKLPYMIAAMIVGSLVAEGLVLLLGPEATAIRTVGALPARLPPLSAPDLSFSSLRQAIGPALVITMLALTEALSIARAIAVRSEQRIDGNQEFIGQGLSNLAGAFFSGYASSGSFNRSGVNYEAGARSPLASVFASIALLLVLLLVAPLAAYLPTAAMGGILFLVAWGLIDFHHIEGIWKASKPEFVILAATLIGTLFNLELGIFLGVFLSLVVYLYRSSRPEIIPMLPATEQGAYHFVEARGGKECPQLRIVRVSGSIYFGAASHVQEALQQIDEDNPLQKSVLITGTGINFVDVAGAEMLAQEARRRRRMGGGLYFYRLRDRVERFLRQGGYARDIGEGAFFPVRTNVVGALYWTLDPEVCRGCKHRIFKECNKGLLPDGFRRQRLMLAIDGSEYAHAPTRIAIALARGFGVTLDIVTVVPTTVDEAAGHECIKPAVRESLVAGVDAEEIVRKSRQPGTAVLEAATDADANILVIGRRPVDGNLRERLLGDNANVIVSQSECHVLVAGPKAEVPSRRLLVAVDGTPRGDAVLEGCMSVAKALKLPVTLIGVYRQEREKRALEEDLQQKSGLLKVEGIQGDTRLVAGQPADAIVAATRDTGADLVALGAHRGQALSRLVAGSVTDRVMAQLDCAVLIVKPDSDARELGAALHDEL